MRAKINPRDADQKDQPDERHEQDIAKGAERQVIRVVREQAKSDGRSCSVTTRKAKAGDAHAGDVAGNGPRTLNDMLEDRTDAQSYPNEGSAPKDGRMVLKDAVYG